jgi:hypothetical protein
MKPTCRKPSLTVRLNLNMKMQRLALCAAILAFNACSSETPQTEVEASVPFIVWPETGSTVFANSAVYVGDPTKEGSIDGTIAIVLGGDGIKAGDAMPSGALQFERGMTHGYVALPTGKQTVHVHLFDKDGKATDQHQAVEYTVEKTPDDAGVQWLEPINGATLKSPFKVRFGMSGAAMSPAGENALDKTTGHHHISIGKGIVTPGIILPMGTEHYLHYGKAQTEAEVTLKPGTYELTMQFADAAHRSYGKGFASKTITVTVQ